MEKLSIRDTLGGTVEWIDEGAEQKLSKYWQFLSVEKFHVPSTHSHHRTREPRSHHPHAPPRVTCALPTGTAIYPSVYIEFADYRPAPNWGWMDQEIGPTFHYEWVNMGMEF